MTDELFAEIVGAVVSLLFSYLPVLEDWYNKLNKAKKRLVMAGVFIVIGVAIFGLSCAGVVNYVECSQAGALAMLALVIRALIANQVAYKLTKKTKRE